MGIRWDTQVKDEWRMRLIENPNLVLIRQVGMKGVNSPKAMGRKKEEQPPSSYHHSFFFFFFLAY